MRRSNPRLTPKEEIIRGIVGKEFVAYSINKKYLIRQKNILLLTFHVKSVEYLIHSFYF